MTTRSQTSRKGFTLIELLTVIAIIGILASILIPTIGNVLTTAHKTAAGSNAGQIAKTYATYSNAGSTSRNIATPLQSNGGTAQNGTAKDINDVAFILSKFTGLNDAKMWFITSDEALSGQTIPKSVILGDTNTAVATATDFQQCTPKSWAFVTGLSTNAPSTTTPLLWTYGLQSTGTWQVNSPWRGTGGHMSFLDGHVDWYDKLSTEPGAASLTVYSTNPNPGTPTADYKQAINASSAKPAAVLNALGAGN